MIEANEVPYGLIDVSNTDINIPISVEAVEVVPHKAYLIEENQLGAYLNFQMFGLSENRINRHINIHINRDINRNRDNDRNVIKRIKCIICTMITIPFTVILLGYISTIWNRR